MAELVAKTGVKREAGYLYFIKNNDVWRTPMKRAGGTAAPGGKTKVAEGNFSREEGFLYYLDKAGNVVRAKRAVGGQKRKKTKRVAAKKAAAKKPAKKAPAKKAPAKKAPAKKAPAKKPAKKK